MAFDTEGESIEPRIVALPAGEELVDALLDETPPFDVDWHTPAYLLDEESRLIRLACVKALLPADNILEEKSTHDVTLENYIRLALQAAGDRDTLASFLRTVGQTLASNRPRLEMLAQQVFWVWAPAAEIADLYDLKTELEERAFEVLLPDEAAHIRDQFEGTDPLALQAFMENTHQLIFEATYPVVSSLRPEDVSARIKSKYNIWRKHKGRGGEYETSDFVGFRVVVGGDGVTEEEEAIGNCYAAVGEICRYFEMDPERFKDYIAQPKPNGYRSLHLTVYTPQGRPFEIQIRTRAMHETVESDVQSAHLLYDAAHKVIPGKIFRSYRKVPKLLTWREAAARSIRESTGSTEILDGEILFFRPDGNLYKTEIGATALDAAFRIHSRRALRAEKIYANGRLINFSDLIGHGDLVDIGYRDEYPKDPVQLGRLKDYVRTERAVKAIDYAKRRLLREAYIAKGKAIVCEKVGNVGLEDPLSELDEADRKYLAQRSGFPSFEEMLFVAGMGNKAGKPGRIANLVKTRMGLGDEAGIKLSRESANTIDDMELLASVEIPNVGGEPNCRVAGCCSHKIQKGEEVVARPIRLEGIMSLHRADCVNVANYPGLFACTWKLVS